MPFVRPTKQGERKYWQLFERVQGKDLFIKSLDQTPEEEARLLAKAITEYPDLKTLLEQNDWAKRIPQEFAKRTAYRLTAKKGSHPLPLLLVGLAESLPLADESIDLIITSPPYNLGQENWPMGGNGRTPRETGIGYEGHEDDMPEDKYQAWQVLVLRELYRVASKGASFFYNHKVRQRSGAIIHPLNWLGLKGNPWIIRQEIVWDRTSTHNHCPVLFWPEDERIYWLTKGKPILPDHSIEMSSVWTFFGPVPNTSGPAPFTTELPLRCLKALGRPGITVLDPFVGSGTTCLVAQQMGYKSIGVDKNASYIEEAGKRHGWMKPKED